MFPEYGFGASKPFGAHLLNFQRRQVSIQPIPVHFPISRGDTVDEIQAEFLATHRVVCKAPSTEPSTPGAAHASLARSRARGIPILCPVRELRLEAAPAEPTRQRTRYLVRCQISPSLPLCLASPLPDC